MPELPLYLSIPLTTLLSMLAVSTTPSCEFLIILLAFLKFQVAQSIAKKEILSVGYIFVGLSSGMTVAHFAPSLDALSSSSLGVFISGICLSITAAISIGLIYVSERNRTAFPGAAFALFPGIWTLAWMTVTQISPIGRLMTWSPFVGSVLDSYRWIRPFVGQPGLDFLVASWATLFSEIAGSYSGILGYRYTNDALIDLEDDDSHNSEGVIKTNHRMIPLLSFTSILLGLALPSFMVSSMPQPPFSPATVPLNVACILPAFQKAEEHSLGVYINETMQFTSRAKILLWPEGAVNFETPKDKMEGLARVQDALYSHSQNTWVGVSFQEPVSDGLQSGTRGRLRRTGLALVGSGGIEFEYYKRKLVPGVSLLHSPDPL
ncbi:hypothetical protein SISSUDRAFT_1042965 [Sistotremastrum suecicum HHB10207 ss-3]|uniref:CN hydrolase domain-containing protein n=1 Tax=Sistotremastrum suecicum HHB10207 ss-3 TaxID=1314776 RepID=A0A166G7D3_9AGAM|nr:hypothetical protein SISSUDRAFT_1042965 [Sistotremastrum suecicum HHB10207 ss-3]